MVARAGWAPSSASVADRGRGMARGRELQIPWVSFWFKMAAFSKRRSPVWSFTRENRGRSELQASSSEPRRKPGRNFAARQVGAEDPAASPARPPSTQSRHPRQSSEGLSRLSLSASTAARHGEQKEFRQSASPAVPARILPRAPDPGRPAVPGAPPLPLRLPRRLRLEGLRLRPPLDADGVSCPAELLLLLL